ncbi:MAG: hypothetical protein ACRC6V_07585 [Bacteroidales bacterium]
MGIRDGNGDGNRNGNGKPRPISAPKGCKPSAHGVSHGKWEWRWNGDGNRPLKQQHIIQRVTPRWG